MSISRKLFIGLLSSAVLFVAEASAQDYIFRHRLFGSSDLSTQPGSALTMAGVAIK